MEIRVYRCPSVVDFLFLLLEERSFAGRKATILGVPFTRE